MLGLDVSHLLAARRPRHDACNARHQLCASGGLAIDAPEENEREQEAEHGSCERCNVLVSSEPPGEQRSGYSAANEAYERHNPDQERQFQLHPPRKLELDRVAGPGAEPVVGRDDLRVAASAAYVQSAGALPCALSARAAGRGTDACATGVRIDDDSIATHVSNESIPPRDLGKGQE